MMRVTCMTCDGTGKYVTINKPLAQVFAEEEDRSPTARQLKVDGINKVARHATRNLLDALFAEFIDNCVLNAQSTGDICHLEFTCETVREFAQRFGYTDQPDWSAIHPNSWGALFSRASKNETIDATGRYVSSTIPSSHARKIQVWQIINK